MTQMMKRLKKICVLQMKMMKAKAKNLCGPEVKDDFKGAKSTGNGETN